MLRSVLFVLLAVAPAFPPLALAEAPAKLFRAGAYAQDITPQQWPVIVNGGMYQRTATKAVDPLHARMLVLDDGQAQIVIGVIDSCAVPRDLFDEAKRIASEKTGIPTERMLISATHTHSAPSVVGALGSDRDDAYAEWLPGQIAEGIIQAHARLAPARIGWEVDYDPKNVHCRRYLMKPGTARTARFTGHTDDRAQMNPGYSNPNALYRLGKVDDSVTVLAVETRHGKPLAVLGNYSTHYAGAPSLSADYFGVFCNEMQTRLGGDEHFVGLMTNGTSGDANCLDFTQQKGRGFTYKTVGKEVADAAMRAYERIRFRDWAPIVMAESKLTLDIRLPSDEEVAEAKQVVAGLKDGLPRTLDEVYAREAVLLAAGSPTRELKLQAIRIGNLAVCGIPCETYGVTGLKIKAASPIETTFTMSLANGAEGYIPPADQHPLGGYNTWRARSACLEVEAERKIRRRILQLLDEVHEQRREELPVWSPGKPPVTDEPPQSSNSAPPRSPLTPEQSLEQIAVAPDLEVQLVAAEPLTMDPVAFDWDRRLRLWVVEMADYPDGVDSKPGGRVRVLTDRDGDGEYDQSQVVADGLPYPNGVLCWRNGALVTAAPDVWYLADDDGDGRIDRREKLLTGLREGNPQLRLNGLRWGLDGWVYCGNGFHTTGVVKSVKSGQELELTGFDLRFDPETGLLERVLGRSQFGRNRDAFGNWFGCSNANPLWHFVVPQAALLRNPHVAPEQAKRELVFGEQMRIFPRSGRSKFFHASQVGRFTSANSSMIYRDDWLGADYAGNAFTSEPVNNLIRRTLLTRQGSSFEATKSPAAAGEFLASTDTWFRPNTIRTGPDGALYFSDMYRETIEHTQWIPEEVQRELDLRAGSDRGRIYRIIPRGRPRRRVAPLASTPTKLAQQLDHPSGLYRDLVQRELLARGVDRPATAILKELAARAKSAAVRVQALWTLHLADQFSEAVLAELDIAQQPPAVQAAVLQIATAVEIDRVAAAVMTRRQLPAEVRVPLALGVRKISSPELAADAWNRLAAEHGDDPGVRTALAASVSEENVGRVLAGLLAPSDSGPSLELVRSVAATAAGLEQRELLRTQASELLQTPTEDVAPWQWAVLAELIRRGGPPRDEILSRHRAAALRELAHAAAPLDRRVAAVDLLQATPNEASDQTLLSVVVPTSDARLQEAAVAALLTRGKRALQSALFARWRSLTPARQRQIIDQALSRVTATQWLLEAIAADDLPRAALTAADRERLLASRSPGIKALASKTLAAEASPRAEVVARYQAALKLVGTAARGQDVFAKQCATCHRIGEVGHAVGPDLASLTNRTPPFLLREILDPNRAVDPRYISYTAITADGRSVSGLLAEEAGESVTLLLADGKRETILRRDLEELVASGRSLMPEGLEQQLTPEQVADLLAYLAQ